MSLPHNSSSIINQIEIAVLVAFPKSSHLKKGEPTEKEGNKVISREPNKIEKPLNDLYIKCFTYNKDEKKIEELEALQ